jgi:hypothetical protein
VASRRDSGMVDTLASRAAPRIPRRVNIPFTFRQ